jgi:hypothetical protein
MAMGERIPLSTASPVQVKNALDSLKNVAAEVKAEGIPVGAGFFWKLVHLNPAVWRGIVMAILALAATFGFVVSDQNTEAIVSAVTALLVIVQAIWTRGAVTANKKVIAYKPDPIEDPSHIVPGEAVSTDVQAVANAAAWPATKPFA